MLFKQYLTGFVSVCQKPKIFNIIFKVTWWISDELKFIKLYITLYLANDNLTPQKDILNCFYRLI